MDAPVAAAEQLDDPAAVEEFAAVARREGRVALDTEFFWERTYAPVLCLLQAATRERVVLVDPLAGGAVEPIAALVSDPGVELVMHAPSSDLLLFALRLGALATRVYDTQVVAGFVGLGVSTGYDRIVEAVLGVRLEHDETFSDWQRRPLSATQLAYAADDVRYLLPLADALEQRLAGLGRGDWAADELARRYGDPAAFEPDPYRAYVKVGRRGRLSGRQLAVLREVAAWREREARRRDLPTGWLVKDPALVEVAKARPADMAALRRLRGLGSVAGAEGERLLEAVREGAAAPPLSAAREPSGDFARRVAAGAALGAILLRARCDAARIAPELVANRADLEDFVRRCATGALDAHPLASGWRHELVGGELEQLVSGRIAVAMSDRAPYVRLEQVAGDPDTRHAS